MDMFSRVRPAIFSLILFLLLGHALGTTYLELKQSRQATGGYYITKIQPTDTYENVEWDELIYYPRGIAAAEGWWPLDPWVFHDQSYGGWGFLPPYSAIVFGRLIALVRDLHVAHYFAVLLSVLLIGFTLRGFFRRAPFQLGNFGASVAAITFIKVPWLGSGIVSFPFQNVIQANVMPFLLGRPSGAFTDMEAGLFTYFPYVVFLVLIWSTCFSGRRRVYLATGLAAGLLIYVYYYHSIFAFALMCAFILVSAIGKNWMECRRYLMALLTGLVCSIPYFVNMWALRHQLDLVEYTKRLEIEPRFSPEIFLYLSHLALPLILGGVYSYFTKPSPLKSAIMKTLWALTLAYVAVVHFRIILGFDVQSDHYWRQSLGLPATLWVIILAVDWVSRLAKENAAISRLVAVALFLMVLLVPIQAFKNSMLIPLRLNRAGPSSIQSALVNRLELLQKFSRPGEVLLGADIPTMYHIPVNLRAFNFVPFVHALASNDQMVQRYYVAQYFAGHKNIRRPMIPGEDMHSSPEFFRTLSAHKFLFGHHSNRLSDDIRMRIETTSWKEFENSDRRLPKIDIIYGVLSDKDRALQRISKRFDILQSIEGDQDWAVRVRDRVGQ